MSTSHFALAQHPETGGWQAMSMYMDAWLVIAGHRWCPTRLCAFQCARTYVLKNWDQDEYAAQHVATLDRLIEAERNHAGDEAHIQTIRALHPETEE